MSAPPSCTVSTTSTTPSFEGSQKHIQQKHSIQRYCTSTLYQRLDRPHPLLLSSSPVLHRLLTGLHRVLKGDRTTPSGYVASNTFFQRYRWTKKGERSDRHKTCFSGLVGTKSERAKQTVLQVLHHVARSSAPPVTFLTQQKVHAKINISGMLTMSGSSPLFSYPTPYLAR